MLDFVAALRTDSARFGELLGGELSAPVPSCPGWSMLDLARHLTEVQTFWAVIAGELRTSPDGVKTGPASLRAAEVGDLFTAASARLIEALSRRSSADRCWSWASDEGTVGWVRRRQAHEALIHRVDAELAANVTLRPIDPALAADGVDEVLTDFMSGVPAWGDFAPDGETVRIEATDAGRRWTAATGRFTGTSPITGRAYDDPAIDLNATSGHAPSSTIRGAAADLDLWLWGRGSSNGLTVVGATGIAGMIRRVAALSTQ
jgi:uncharacterized protein (TIGR03083 family)